MSEQEMFARLRQPFTNETIKWKIQTNPKEDDSFALCVAYIDARDVAARLNEVVGINWESSYSDLIFFSDEKKGEIGVQCRLTVMGHTRTDIGTLPSTEPLKGGYSDALKRAAVQFGIAAYVYAFPVVKAEVQKYGRSYYFTPNAKKELAQLVQAIHSGVQRLPKFHAIQVRDYAPILFDSPYFGGEGEGVTHDVVDVVEEDKLTPCEGEGCQNTIMGYKSMSAESIEKGTRDKYGIPLCWDCAQKYKKAAEQAGDSKLKDAATAGIPPADIVAIHKGAAKKALEDARGRYQEASHIGQQLAFEEAGNPKYLQWSATKLDEETQALTLLIQDAIQGSALQNDDFLADEENAVLPDHTQPLEEWMAFAVAWQLVQTIRADNLQTGFDIEEPTQEEILAEIPN